MGVSKLKILGLAVALAALVATAGCGGGDSQDEADLTKGRDLFSQHCGECHILAEAGTGGEIGPDLDAAFAEPRFAGMNDATIEGVVRTQIANPRRPSSPDEPAMPPDLVTGDDARDVAAYVGMVAGVPGAEPPERPPPQFFAETCGGCHALSDAGTTGNPAYPDLDQSLPRLDADQVRAALLEGPGPMPSFADLEQEDPEFFEELIDYLLGTADGGG